LKALKLTKNDLKASSRVCSFHFFGNERKKNDVPSLEIGEQFGAKSGRKNTKDKMRQYEKNQVKQDGKKINNTSQKSPHPEVTSLPVSELNNVEKIEVGPSGDNVPSALNPNIDLIANINELERKNRQLTEQNLNHSLHQIFLQFRETERHFSYVRHQRNEKSKLDLTLSDSFQSI
jgi:hypothetical protein